MFNFACINFIPLIFGYEFVWYTVTISECICMVIAMILRIISGETELFTDNKGRNTMNI